ncbi:MAG: transposase [Chloroflexi bacterium]|nr:transposase [Chloroflexota bacterium]
MYANVQLDATFVKVRQEHRVVNMAIVMAAGVKLVTSDAHEGLKAAMAAVLQGASWKRCRTRTSCVMHWRWCRGWGFSAMSVPSSDSSAAPLPSKNDESAIARRYF